MHRESSLVAGLLVSTGIALLAALADVRVAVAREGDSLRATAFGGPGSASAQIESDEETKRPTFLLDRVTQAMQPYYDFKERVQKDFDLAFGADYNLLYQHASDSPGRENAAGGVFRVYGTWTLLGRGTEDSGSLVFKAENRHRLGADLTPNNLAGEIGYAGLTAQTFSDAGTLLTNLYWHQNLLANRLGFVIGIVDASDYVDVYGLVNPWTDFSNLAFANGPTTPIPSQGLGAAVRWSLTDHYYVLAGFANANGDPSDLSDSVDSFFDDHEYFKHMEFGWIESWANRMTNNIHVTAWQVDKRTKAQVPDGSGFSFSYSMQVTEQWLPFLRVGYADSGGAVLDRSVSAGFGYTPLGAANTFGLGVNWGRPNRDLYGAGRDDQYTLEAYYRMQLFRHFVVTPDVQLLINPPLDPDESTIWILGLRARLAF